MEAQLTKVDPSEHLPLIYRVIGQMGLRGDVAEEAFSESLVTITEAAMKYDPSKEIPVANWLANNIRWGLYNWLRKQRHDYATFRVDDDFFKNSRAFGVKDNAQNKVELNETLLRIDELLTESERQVILATAAGFKGVEIAKELAISPVAVHRLKNSARKKLREEK